MRLSVALLLSVVFTVSTIALFAGAVLSYAVSLGSVRGVNVPVLGESLVLAGLVGFLLFVLLLGAWALRTGGVRGQRAR